MNGSKRWKDLANNLEGCSVHPGHQFFNKLAVCPWCRIESQTGLMLFPFVSATAPGGTEPFNIFTVENLIANLGVSNNLPRQTARYDDFAAAVAGSY